jgi:acyl carrier protein
MEGTVFLCKQVKAGKIMQANIDDLREIFRDVFDNPNLEINSGTVAADVEEWDSLNHIQLIVAIEKRYKVKFTFQEIENWKKVGDVIDCINSKSKQ